MKVLVMGGKGLVGQALVKALGSVYEVEIVDLDGKPAVSKFDILHVAIPFQGDFQVKVTQLAREYKVDNIIVHSTVPTGTTRGISVNAVHSPILGQHDNLEESIFRFTKWVGCASAISGRHACSHMQNAGLDARILGKTEDTETLKLLCLARYLHDLAFYENAEKIMGQFKGVEKNLLFKWNNAYNEGYKGTKFVRSNLSFPNGKIGGKCVAQNTKLLFDLTKNEMLKRDLETFKLI